MDLKYTVTRFDNENKIVFVEFEDGAWAEIRLINPLPKTTEELESRIKQFAPPVEAIEARINPDADLSYINDLVGVEQITSRLQLTPSQELNSSNAEQTIDPDVEANMKMWEELEFQKKVGDALVKMGIVSTNPTEIPVATIS